MRIAGASRTRASERPMKFGLYSSIANPPRGEHLERAIDQVIAEAQQAEASGFDSCFFGEHHQDKDGFLPSPLIVATAGAARTRRSRAGRDGGPTVSSGLRARVSTTPSAWSRRTPRRRARPGASRT